MNPLGWFNRQPVVLRVVLVVVALFILWRVMQAGSAAAAESRRRSE